MEELLECSECGRAGARYALNVPPRCHPDANWVSPADDEEMFLSEANKKLSHEEKIDAENEWIAAGRPTETTKWGDTVTAHASGAKRANGGKLRYDLLPVVALRDTAQVFTFGAEKYTETIDRTPSSALSWLQKELEKCLIASSVLPNHIAKTCVAAATSGISVKTILNMLRDNAKTQETGEKQIQIALKHFSKNESMIRTAESETQKRRSSMHSSGSDSQKIPLHFYYKSKSIPVQFVNATFLNARVISIIAMRQGKQEAIFAVGATTDSECLETILQACKEHFDISTNHQLKASSFSSGDPIAHTISGEGNWTQGFNWSGPYASMMRHLHAWWAGEDFDKESGVSHLAHAACNLMFLQHFEYNYKQGDDRPSAGLAPMRKHEQEEATPARDPVNEKRLERSPALDW